MEAKQLTVRPFITAALGKRMLAGAVIGLVVIAFFVIAAGKGNPAWGDYWRVKPLLLTPLLGIVTGACYDATEPLRRLQGWLGKLFFVLSFAGYFIGLWLALVLRLAGTLWN
ncbi:MAG: potassium transporter KefB [Mucilaginibacter sp.]|nr:potassium transporter KefB [Mucilaginibacter sp.]